MTNLVTIALAMYLSRPPAAVPGPQPVNASVTVVQSDGYPVTHGVADGTVAPDTNTPGPSYSCVAADATVFVWCSNYNPNAWVWQP